MPTLAELEAEAQRRGLQASGRLSSLEAEAQRRGLISEPVSEKRRGAGLRREAEARATEQEEFLASLSPERRELLESISPMEAALIGAGRGLTTIGRGLGIVEPETPQELEAIEQLKQVRPLSTGAGEIAGQAAPFIAPGMGVAGIAGTAGRVGGTAALGATEAGLIARGEGRGAGEQLKAAGIGGTVAGALELGLPVLGRLGGKVVRRQLGQEPSVPVVNSMGEPSDELIDALNKQGRSFDELIATAKEEIAGQTDEALTASAPLPRSVDKALLEAAPTIEQLKAQSRSIYGRIDDLGATIRPDSFDGFVDDVSAKLKKAGFDPGLHPKAASVLNRLNSEKGQIKQLTEIDILRRVALGASKSIEPDEKRVGGIILESFDDYLDNLKGSDFAGAEFSGIGPQYKEARNLWGKARRSEMIHEAIEKAKDQASGFENGIRVQLRAILNSKKRSMGFSKDELAAMKEVVRGTKMANIAKFLGRFGINERQATSMLGASVGIGGGASIGSAVGGTAGAGIGAIVLPAIGQVSKELAQKLTRNNARLADTIVRAGTDGKKIVQAYFAQVPKSKRNSAELTQLLMRPNISLEAISKIKPKDKATDKMLSDALHLIKTIEPAQLRQLLGLTSAAAATTAMGDEE